jgi:hypothetical protein
MSEVLSRLQRNLESAARPAATKKERHSTTCSVPFESGAPVRGHMFVEPIGTLFERTPLGMRPGLRNFYRLLAGY